MSGVSSENNSSRRLCFKNFTCDYAGLRRSHPIESSSLKQWECLKFTPRTVERCVGLQPRFPFERGVVDALGPHVISIEGSRCVTERRAFWGSVAKTRRSPAIWQYVLLFSSWAHPCIIFVSNKWLRAKRIPSVCSWESWVGFLGSRQGPCKHLNCQASRISETALRGSGTEPWMSSGPMQKLHRARPHTHILIS